MVSVLFCDIIYPQSLRFGRDIRGVRLPLASADVVGEVVRSGVMINIRDVSQCPFYHGYERFFFSFIYLYNPIGSLSIFRVLEDKYKSNVHTILAAPVLNGNGKIVAVIEVGL